MQILSFLDRKNRYHQALVVRLFTWFGRIYDQSKNSHYTRIGTDYGGWFVPMEKINKNWICYCVGLGEDASFDLGLIEQFKCNVWSFDPTPRSILYAKNINNKKFIFMPYAIWKKNGSIKFFEPQDPLHVSHSITNLQSTEKYIEVPCLTLKQAMKKVGHSQIDLLKLDIEGAHHAVLQKTLKDKIFPKIICVEFDQPDSLFSICTTLLRMYFNRYKITVVDGYNVTFLRKK